VVIVGILHLEVSWSCHLSAFMSTQIGSIDGWHDEFGGFFGVSGGYAFGVVIVDAL
jgi:hypothetical protein